MPRILPAAVLAVLLGSAALAHDNIDFLIVPDARVGRVVRGTDEMALRGIYGAERVKPHLVEMGEGFVCHGGRIVLDNGDSLEITWLDPRVRAGAASVHVKGSTWHTKEGLRFGLTLKEVERINGKPFKLAGFGWDYGGTVTSWNDGILARSMAQTPTGRLILRLAPVMSGPDRASRADMQRLMGDRDFSSGHPDMQKLNPRVYDLVVVFDRSAQCEAFFKG